MFNDIYPGLHVGHETTVCRAERTQSRRSLLVSPRRIIYELNQMGQTFLIKPLRVFVEDSFDGVWIPGLQAPERRNGGVG